MNSHNNLENYVNVVRITPLPSDSYADQCSGLYRASDDKLVKRKGTANLATWCTGTRRESNNYKYRVFSNATVPPHAGWTGHGWQKTEHLSENLKNQTEL